MSNYQKQVNAQTGAMGPTVVAVWPKTATTSGNPWDLGAQPLSYDPAIGKYVSAYDTGAARDSISFGFGKPLRQYFTKGMPMTIRPLGYGSRSRSRRRKASRSRRSRRHRSHRRSRRHRRPKKSVGKTVGELEEKPMGTLAKIKEKINSILGRKANEYGYGTMAFGAPYRRY